MGWRNIARAISGTVFAGVWIMDQDVTVGCWKREG